MSKARALPPTVQPLPPYPPTPVATFLHNLRRYTRSNMHVCDTPTSLLTDEVTPSRNLRKSTRIHDTKSIPTSISTPCAKEEEPPSLVSSSPRSTRKRKASLEGLFSREDVADTSISAEIHSPQSAVSAGSGEYSPRICLCQPEPKIPRPRNAFILYRQHHQQSIIARNPGLNNSEISKIIGEQWKAEGEESKKGWQELAEEEKIRHHEQYPDYRYQPRRIAKPGSSPLNPSVQHTTVDNYRCPRCGGRSIKTPTSPFLDSDGMPTLPPPNISEGLTTTTRYLPVISNLSLESPVRRRGHGPSSLSNIQVPLLREETAMCSPLTPSNKKRRFDYGPPPSNSRRSDGLYCPQYVRRGSLPPIQVQYSPPNSATMPPPPRNPRDARRRLLADGSTVSEHQDQSSRSLEEVLMTFPYHNKIKLLGRISLPYNEVASISSAPQIRGAIIAVEGDEIIAVKELCEWLSAHLAKDSETTYRPNIVEPPTLPKDEGVTFENYLDLIKEWHIKSKEMIKYITTASESISLSPSADTFEKNLDKDTFTNDAKDSMLSSDSPSPSTTSSCTSPAPSAAVKPIIILPTFQLAASVAYASRIPIQDAYSMTDHWQWMATLWRGTVGPDITIYVKTLDKGSSGSKPEMDDAVRCLTVGKEKEGKFTDADLRRVGFEVSEFIKGMA